MLRGAAGSYEEAMVLSGAVPMACGAVSNICRPLFVSPAKLYWLMHCVVTGPAQQWPVLSKLGLLFYTQKVSNIHSVTIQN